MKSCLIVCVFLGFCLTSSYGHDSGSCQNRVYELLARIECVQEELKICQSLDLPSSGCGELPVIANTVLTASSHETGSVADVTCDELFQYFGERPQITCLESGEWSELEGSCGQVEFLDISIDSEDGVDFDLPAPLTTGFIMETRCTPEDDTVIFFYGESDGEHVVAVEMYVDSDETYITTPSEFSQLQPNPVTKGVTFDLKVTFGESNVQFEIDGVDMAYFDPLVVSGITRVIITSTSFNAEYLKYSY